MKKKLLLLVFAVVGLMVADPVRAVPFWDVGAPGSTHQVWTFDDADNPAVPEVSQNDFGTALATIGGGLYNPDPEWQQGVWQGESVEITMNIPNRPVPDLYKEIWVEIGFRGNLGHYSAIPVPFGGSVEQLSEEIQTVDNDWQKLTVGWRIYPNPDSERICFIFTDVAALDYVTVDTICIPEPATVALLGLGGLLLRKRKTL